MTCGLRRALANANVAGARPMNSPSSQSISAEGRRSSQRRLIRVIVGLCVLTGTGLAGWYVWHASGAVEPPRADLSSAEPELVKAVDEARTAVRKSPRSANAWGHLGMLFLAHAFLPEAEECFS